MAARKPPARLPRAIEPVFFASPAAFGAWLERHAATHGEVHVGFHKRATGKPSMTWSESVDEALCHGWIDGVRNGIDESTYRIRFTPRKPSSTWSAINIAKIETLQGAGRLTAAGLAAYACRQETNSRIYSYEQPEAAALAPQELAHFRKSKAAWKFFEAQPPGYRRQMIYRVVSAKREETREGRLTKLIEASAKGIRLL